MQASGAYCWWVAGEIEVAVLRTCTRGVFTVKRFTFHCWELATNEQNKLGSKRKIVSLSTRGTKTLIRIASMNCGRVPSLTVSPFSRQSRVYQQFSLSFAEFVFDCGIWYSTSTTKNNVNSQFDLVQLFPIDRLFLIWFHDVKQIYSTLRRPGAVDVSEASLNFRRWRRTDWRTRKIGKMPSVL